jgi:hypothetical protein
MEQYPSGSTTAAQRRAGSVTRAVAWIHAVPTAMCPHVEWAIARAVGEPLRLDWSPQPLLPRHQRAEISWVSHPGTAAALASALRPMARIWFEVAEDASGVPGERFSFTPGLGLFRAAIDAHGDIVIHESRLRLLLDEPEIDVHEGLALLLGREWDAELEPFRIAGEADTVRVLHHVV